MKVLLVHNYYGSKAPFGENQFFKTEINLLRQRRHKVNMFTRCSDTIRAKGAMGVIYGAIATPCNYVAARDMRGKMHGWSLWPLYCCGHM